MHRMVGDNDLMSDAGDFAMAADVMLGRLVRWLRLMGFDVLYSNRWEDAVLASVAARENRWLLTRDRDLLRRYAVRKHLFITSDVLGAQLRQVLANRTPDPRRYFTRCVRCNDRLVPASSEEVCSLVPVHILRTESDFHHCPRCRRVYWHGTHREQALSYLDEILGTHQH